MYRHAIQKLININEHGVAHSSLNQLSNKRLSTMEEYELFSVYL